MSLIIALHNISRLADVSDYEYQVLVGDCSTERSQTLETGYVRGHRRVDGWAALVAKFVHSREVKPMKCPEYEDWRRSFDSNHEASMALMRAYKRAHPEVPANVWPDVTTVNVWAAEQIEKLLEALRGPVDSK